MQSLGGKIRSSRNPLVCLTIEGLHTVYILFFNLSGSFVENGSQRDKSRNRKTRAGADTGTQARNCGGR